MPALRSPLRSLPALLLAVGFGMCGYYGLEWYELPTYSEEEVAASVELNLQIDLQRRGAHLQPDTAGLQRMREIVRAEVDSEIRRERGKIELRFGVGLIALVLGIGSLISERLLRA